MSLNNFYFIISFVPLLAILLLLQAVRRKFGIAGRMQLLIMLIFSYGFICYSDIRFGVCVAAMTAISYISGVLLDSHSNKRPILVGGV